tara:strand:+ start:386 stop:739 length:354 start_codon:yes stop_codon:yes gene_type:complete
MTLGFCKHDEIEIYTPAYNKKQDEHYKSVKRKYTSTSKWRFNVTLYSGIILVLFWIVYVARNSDKPMFKTYDGAKKTGIGALCGLFPWIIWYLASITELSNYPSPTSNDFLRCEPTI